MDSSMDFDINESLKQYLSDPASIQTPEADATLLDCESDPEALTSNVVNSVLNPIVEAIAENPEALSRSSVFDSLQFLLKCAPTSHSADRSPLFRGLDSELFNPRRSSPALPTHSLSKIFDVIISGLSTQTDVVNNDLETEEQETIQHHKQLLEMYGFLIQWTVSICEVKAAERTATAPQARGRGGGKGAKSKTGAKDGVWDSTAQLQSALEVMCKVLKLKLGKVFVTTSERDTFVGLFTRSVYLVFESEQRTKNTAIRMHAFKVLCIAIKHHGHAFGACLQWR
jgi:condensin complex subunit 1